MKLKLASLGLLALAPLAAQAELVEMQDTELAAVNGGQAGHGLTFNFNLTLDKTIAGLDVYKNVYGYKLSPTDWELGKESEISNPVSGRWAYKSLYFGNDQGVKYVNPYFSWGRDQNPT
jgi:hypothetical protein